MKYLNSEERRNLENWGFTQESHSCLEDLLTFLGRPYQLRKTPNSCYECHVWRDDNDYGELMALVGRSESSAVKAVYRTIEALHVA